jgi:hypothetical protein
VQTANSIVRRFEFARERTRTLLMYPVIPLEMNQFAADSLLFLFTAVSTLLSVVYGLRG